MTSQPTTSAIPDSFDSHEDEERSRKKARISKDVPRLACPYYQRNPVGAHIKPICKGPGWLKIGRLKYVDHLPLLLLH